MPDFSTYLFTQGVLCFYIGVTGLQLRGSYFELKEEYL